MQGTFQNKSNWIRKILHFPFVLTGFLLKVVIGILLAAALIVVGYSLYREPPVKPLYLYMGIKGCR